MQHREHASIHQYPEVTLRIIRLSGSRSRTRALGAAITCVALLIVTGCGSSGDSGGGNNNADAKFDPKGVLKVGVSFGQVTVIDPNDDSGLPAPAGYWSNLIYGTNIGEGETVDKGVPGLFTEWSTPDDNTINLTLRDGVKFSDGTPFNAEAVKYSWDRCKADDGFKLDLFLAMDSVTAVDETHVEVKLSLPYAGVWTDYLIRQPVYCMPIVSPTAAKAEGDKFGDKPIGAGPYMLESYVAGQKLTLVPNPEFYDKTQQTFARIEFIQTAPGPATITALASGQIDLAAVTPGQFAALKQQNIDVVSGPASTVFHINMCTGEGPLADPDARLAIMHAIDPDEINQAVYKGEYTVDSQVVPPFYPYFSSDQAESEFDLDQAKELADSSGLSGQTIDLMFFSISPDFATMAELIKSQLAKIDVDVNLIPSQNIFADKLAQKPDMDLWAFFPASVPTTLAPGQINNTCGTDIPELTAALKDVYRADATAAQAAWDTVAKAVSEQAPVVPLLSSIGAMARTDRVAGEIVLPKDGFWGLDWSKIGIAAN
jgi:ABC-type transport system substrate-binding protein